MKYLPVLSAKAIPSHNRHLILNLFCQNNVDLIYSGKYVRRSPTNSNKINLNRLFKVTLIILTSHLFTIVGRINSSRSFLHQSMPNLTGSPIPNIIPLENLNSYILSFSKIKEILISLICNKSFKMPTTKPS